MLTSDSIILDVDANGIPASLAAQRRWVCWKGVPTTRKDGTVELSKQPRQPARPSVLASSTNETTWGTLAQALTAYGDGHASGIGFVLGDGIMGIDLDDVRDPETGTLKPAAQMIVDRLGTYTEVSPSGTGVHLLLHGSVPEGRKRRVDGITVEVYAKGRYFTVTGNRHPGTPLEVVAADDSRMAEVMRLREEEPRPVPARSAISVSTVSPCSPTDVDVVEVGHRVCKGFAALWGGDSSRHAGDESAADQGLANHLAWLCGPNGHDQVRRLLMQSGRRRDKFETHKNYLDLTIAKAYEGAQRFYEWERTASPSATSIAMAIAAPPTDYRPPDVPRGAATIERPETLNDIGLGRRLVHEAAGELLYVANRRVWSHWDGMRWVDDPSAVWPQRLAKRVADRLFDESRPVRAAMDRAGLTFILDTASRRRVDAAVAMARSEPDVEADSGEFDRDPYTLNVQNGILDLRTLELRPHDKAARLSQLANAAFDPTAKCPRWREFIDAVTCGDNDLAKFLQRSFGLALSADQSEQRLWMHWGEGSNGKGTALSVLASVLGTYGGPVPVEVLVSRRNDSDRELHAASLVGKRLAFAQEADDGVRLSEATVKALTGSDRITARRRYQDNFQVDPTWHLHLAVNDRPIIRGNDHGIWRRVMLVPWKHTFDGAAKRDRAEVEAELRAEASGILNWLVAGFADWKDQGLRPPAVVTGATADYRAASDSVRSWLADACVIDSAAMTGSTDLFENFSQWCKRAGFGAVSQTKFSKTLEDLGFAKSKPTSGPMRDRIVRTGLRLTHFQTSAEE